MKYIFYFLGATAIIAIVTETSWVDVLAGGVILIVGGLILLYIGGWLIWNAFEDPDFKIKAVVIIGILAFAWYAKQHDDARAAGSHARVQAEDRLPLR
jgi:hypothetical protein